jgi:RNA polymerase sigma-70 factor (ECF subfamily)
MSTCAELSAGIEAPERQRSIRLTALNRLSELLLRCDYLTQMDDGRRTAAQEQRYAEVTATFGAALERLARGYERDPDKCRDLLQDIHVAVWRSLARFDSRCSLRTWVYRVAHNTATSKVLRRTTNAPTLIPLDDSLESIAGRGADEERLFDRRRTLERLHELIQQLRPLDRQVVLLCLEQIDAASIAEITGLSPANVATKVHRIKQILVQRFHQGSRDGQ